MIRIGRIETNHPTRESGESIGRVLGGGSN
jgi:hypothetical protein